MVQNLVDFFKTSRLKMERGHNKNMNINLMWREMRKERDNTNVLPILDEIWYLMVCFNMCNDYIVITDICYARLWCMSIFLLIWLIHILM